MNKQLVRVASGYCGLQAKDVGHDFSGMQVKLLRAISKALFFC